MSNLVLTNRPPDVPTGRSFSFHTKNTVNVKQMIRWPDLPTKLALYKTIGRVETLLKAFCSIPITGAVTIVVTSTSMTRYEGELTAYHQSVSQERDILVREIDVTLFSFRREFASCIDEITFTFEQTCEFTPDSTASSATD